MGLMAVSEFLKHRENFSNRYRATKILVDDAVSPGRRRYGIWTIPKINIDSHRRHTVTGVDDKRLDVIAYRYYGDPTMWWVLAVFNGIKNQLTDMEVGQVIIVPRQDEVRKAFAEVVEE
jgi:hypothetical protein